MGLFSAILGNAGAVSNEELHKEFGKLLCEGENFEMGFKVMRDLLVFTNKRLILVDKQGLSGKKVEYKSIAFKSITRFSIETAGELDLDAELKIWVSSEASPSVSYKFNKTVDIYDVQKVLAHFVLK